MLGVGRPGGGGYIAMNNFLINKGWGKEASAPSILICGVPRALLHGTKLLSPRQK